MRIYLPSTSTAVLKVLDAGRLSASASNAVFAFAVTPALREHYSGDAADESDESLEYAAQVEAARASLRLLDADESALRRRVVIAADVDESWVRIRDDLDRGVVQLEQDLPVAAIASAHIDDADAEPVVARAAASMMAAELGDQAAQDAVDDAEGFELGWYATQEIALLFDLA